MSFVYAFLVGGLMCGLFQVVMMITKLRPPEMLILGFTLGGVLLPTGVVAWLEKTGGAGMSVMVLDGGAGTFAGLMGLFHGSPALFINVLAIFATLTIIGIITGALASARTTGEGTEAAQAS